jgi:STE24 endopeptidase
VSTVDDAAAGREAQRWAWLLVLVGGLGFVLVAWLLVPWHWLPDGRQITPVSPSEAFTHRQLVRADSYSSAQRTLSLTSYGVSLLVTFGLGFTPLGARLLGRLRGWWWVRVTLGCFLLLLIGELVTLPLALAIRHNALQAGLTNQDLAGWLRDDLVGLLVSTVFTAIGAMVLIGLARRLPRVWPLCAGVLSALLVVLGSFVYPLVVEPLFNRFTSLPAGPLRTSILRLAAVEHVRVDDVLVADASRRTTSLNAYVTGFGSTRRVVLYDNTVNDLKQAEIESVVAHELGHARHDDVLLGTVLGACGAALGVGLLGLIVARPGVRRRSGITGMADPRAVALLLALTAAASFLASPVENTISRAIEARADLSALDATRDPVAFVELQKQLAISSLQQPAPPEWDQLWFGSHPTPVQRIGMARTLAKAYDEGAR